MKLEEELSSKYKKVVVLPGFLSDEGPMLETLDYTIRVGCTPTIFYFDLYLYSAYAGHYIYVFKVGSGFEILPGESGADLRQ